MSLSHSINTHENILLDKMHAVDLSINTIFMKPFIPNFVLRMQTVFNEIDGVGPAMLTCNS